MTQPPPLPALPPLLFPLWGASPIHKDVFVEMDTYAPLVNANNLFQWTQANLAAARYADLGQQNNPDGLPGIRPHFDLATACNDEPGDVDGISATCGVFGGASTVPIGQACNPNGNPPVLCPGGQVCTPFGTCSPGCSTDGGNMAPNRQGRFHWAIRNNVAQGDVLGYGHCHDNRWTVVTHELGHNFGLWHWGANSAGIANFKPQYPSLMSYQFQDNSAFTFSDGSRAAPLDPQNVSEVSPFGTSADVSHMPTYFDVPVDPVTKSVDWNHDGVYSPSVRAHICCKPDQTQGGGDDVPTNVANENMRHATTNVGPAAVAWKHGSTPATYVFLRYAAEGTYTYAYSTQVWGGWSACCRAPRPPI